MNKYYVTVILKNGRMFSSVVEGASRYDAMVSFMKNKRIKFENLLKYMAKILE